MIYASLPLARTLWLTMLVGAATSIGCSSNAGDDSAADDVPHVQTGTTSPALDNGSGNDVVAETAGGYAWHTTVSVTTNLPGGVTIECTGTIISPRHVVTAASCLPREGTSIGFFWNGGPASWPASYVTQVYELNEATSANGYVDGYGDHANIAVLLLNDPVPFQVSAWLGLVPPPTGSSEFQVGLGARNGDESTFGTMAEHVTTIEGSDIFGAGSSYNTNWLLTADPGSTQGPANTLTFGGDMGGPLLGWPAAAFVGDDEGSALQIGLPTLPPGEAMSLIAVYTGSNVNYDSFSSNRAAYTIVDPSFVLSAAGMTVNNTGFGTVPNGTNTIATFHLPSGSAAELCADLCLKHRACVADSWNVQFDGSQICNLFSETGPIDEVWGADTRSFTGACDNRDAAGICRCGLTTTDACE